MILTGLFILLVSVLYATSFVKAATLNDVPNNVNKSENTLDYNLQHKLDSLTNSLTQIDVGIQSLHEKAHNWAIFRHHIDSWNEQMKTLEQKLELVKRTQDEQTNYGNKLLSLEFTLNHILSKVVYLSESCQSAGSGAKALSSRDEELVSELQSSMNAEKKVKHEISTRLNNILRHVQNIESDQGCRKGGKDAASSASKLARLMTPVGGCNASQRYNYNIEQSLKTLEHKLSVVAGSFSQKDFKQMHALSKKNAKDLESILSFVSNTDQRLAQWQEEGTKSASNCQEMSNELSTFTESSDLLLKRIELLVRAVNEQLSKRAGLECSKLAGKEEQPKQVPVETQPSSGGTPSKASEGIDETMEEASAEAPPSPTYEANPDDSEDTADDSEQEVEEKALDTDFELLDSTLPEKSACHELAPSYTDGVYKFATPDLNEEARDFNERYCAFATTGLAWTVIQNRGPYAEQTNFNRSWADYRSGFGELKADFWFGNEFIHQLVYRDDYELRIELEDWSGEQRWAEYSIFRVDSERYNYNLLIGGYRGNVPDAMDYHNEMDFSTYDRRNDKSVDACCACATGYASGWWYDSCSEANLNGVYHHEPLGHNYIGIMWEHWHGDYSLQRARMMIRPRNWETDGEVHAVYNELNEDP